MVELIDLTMPIEAGMNSHPLQQPPEPYLWKSATHGSTFPLFEKWDDPVLNPDGKAFSTENETVVMSLHTGTHMDAPIHVDPDSDVDIGDVEPERFHTDCVLLDVSDDVEADEPIEADTLQRAAEAAGIDPDEDIEPGDSLFVRTDWSNKYRDDEEMYFAHPGLTDSSAKWCLERDIGLVGIDCPNIDLTSSRRQPSHVGFLRRGWPETVLVIENLFNLTEVPEPTFEVWMLPLPIEDGSGSPTRVIALVEE